MHITLFTIGSRGDIQPFIALGRQLRQYGAQVRLATHERFRPLAQQHQLNFVPIHSDPLAMLNTPAGQSWIHSGKNPIPLVANMIKLGRPVFQQLIQDASEACQGTDLIVYTIFGSVAHHLAEKQGIPAVMVNLQPLLGARTDFPVPGSPQLFSSIPWLKSRYNRFTYRAAQQLFWQPFRPLVQKWRKKTLNLTPAPFFGPYRQLWQEKTALIHAYSPAIVPSAPDWPAWYHTTGYWTLPPSQGWTPPADLVTFLEKSAHPPIYFGFGSMADQHPKKLLKIIVSALGKTGQRGLILRGWAGLESDNLPDHIHLISSAPHSWLFRHVAGTVHHGGAGTTGSALTAGKQTLIIPYFADQHFWGERVYQLGAGPRPIPRNKLTEENLIIALDEMQHNRSMQSKAMELGILLQKENGAKRAAQILLALN